MSCYSCSAKFGFLKKEVGCEVCGFSFCTRCCKRYELPSDGEGTCKRLLCQKCYSTLTSNKPTASKISPPLAHKKRMAALRIQSSSVDSSCQWSDERDKEMAERLQKLKRDRIKDAVPTEDDIAVRLAKLKGMDPAKFNSPPIEVYRPPSMQTVVEQAAALMKQFALEAELDSRRVKPEDEIAARLARLRDEQPPDKEKKVQPEIDTSTLQPQGPPEEQMDIDKVHSDLQEESQALANATAKELGDLLSDDEYKKVIQAIPKTKGKTESEDEEDEANELVQKLLATNPDDEGLDSLNDDTEESNSKSDKDATEEFPWCVICTEDAKIRCFGCDSDLYCLHCFKDCHDSLDIKDHKTCPYLSSKNSVM